MNREEIVRLECLKLARSDEPLRKDDLVTRARPYAELNLDIKGERDA